MRSISLIVAGIALVAIGILAVLLDSALAAAGVASFTGWSLAPIALGALLVWAARIFPPITYPYNPAKAQRMLARRRGSRKTVDGKAAAARHGLRISGTKEA